jgi:hypothetical protein
MEAGLAVDRVRNGQIGGYAKRCLEIDLLPSTPLHDKQASGIEALHDRGHRSRADVFLHGNALRKDRAGV